MAVEDELQFNQIVDDIEAYKDLQETASALEEDINGRIAQNEEREKHLNDARGVEKVRTQIAINREERSIDKLSKDRDLREFQGVRADLLRTLGRETGAADLAREKLAEQLYGGVEGDLQSVDKAQKHFNTLQDRQDNYESSFDYTATSEKFNKDDFTEKLNKSAEERVEKAVKSCG